VSGVSINLSLYRFAFITMPYCYCAPHKPAPSTTHHALGRRIFKIVAIHRTHRAVPPNCFTTPPSPP